MPHRLITLLLCFGSVLVGGEDCGSSQWPCASHQHCIDQSEVCDGQPHCADKSDETFHVCSGYLTCPPYGFRCAYGGCVDGDSPCNGTRECADGSDELLPACPGVVFQPDAHTCKGLEVPCLTGDQCIDGDQVCDGAVDCADGSDETITRCINFQCPPYGFRCAYGGCVDGDSPCNGTRECADGSDEFAPQCEKTDPAAPTEPPTALPTKDSTTEPTVPRITACELPPAPSHGTYTSYTCLPGSTLPQCSAVAGTQVPLGFDLHYSCFNGFALQGNSEQYCLPGGWHPTDVPTCSDECEPLISSRLDLHCFRSNFSLVSCGERLPANSFARFSCRPSVYIKVKEPGYDRLVCKGGKWNRPLTDDFCQPACGRAVLKFAQPVVSFGTPAVFGAFPWHAGIFQLQMDNETQTEKWKLNCGGSLVSDKVVLTAAHCFKKEVRNVRGLVDLDIGSMKVALGKVYSQLDHPEDDHAQIFDIAQVIVNPFYTGSKDNYGDDIAMVILAEPVRYTVGVLPVCLDLGPANIEEDQLVPGATGMVAGWGLTEHQTISEKLLVANMPFVPREVCLQSSSLYTYITRDKMCGGDPKTKTSVCKGDSGGGYVFQGPTKAYYLRGVVSLGAEGCQGQEYALFTRVSKHADFINKYL